MLKSVPLQPLNIWCLIKVKSKYKLLKNNIIWKCCLQELMRA